MEKKTNGVRAALRVENRVAVREREDSMMTMRNPTRSGLASARAAREGWISYREMWTRCGRGKDWNDARENARGLTGDDAPSFAHVDSLHAQGSQKGTLLPYHRH